MLDISTGSHTFRLFSRGSCVQWIYLYVIKISKAREINHFGRHQLQVRAELNFSRSKSLLAYSTKLHIAFEDKRCTL